MSQLVLNVAYGFNGDRVSTLTEKQLLRAFFLASDNLPTIGDKYRKPIIANMCRIADRVSDLTDTAKGQRKIRLTVHLLAMQVIIKKLYETRTA